MRQGRPRSTRQRRSSSSTANTLSSPTSAASASSWSLCQATLRQKQPIQRTKPSQASANATSTNTIKAGGAAAMLYDLLKLDLGNWHPRKVPQTKALLEQKMLSLGGLEQWWVAMLDVGELPCADKKNPRRVRSELLLEAAQN